MSPKASLQVFSSAKGAIEEVLATAEILEPRLPAGNGLHGRRAHGQGPCSDRKQFQSGLSNLLDGGLDEAFLWKAHQELPDFLYGPTENEALVQRAHNIGIRSAITLMR